jgi:hypothetical protein
MLGISYERPAGYTRDYLQVLDAAFANPGPVDVENDTFRVHNPLDLVPVAPLLAPQPGQGAPPTPVHNGTAYWIKVAAEPDGSLTVTNSRNGFSKTYKARTS